MDPIMAGPESTDIELALKELAQDLLTDRELADLPTLDLTPLLPTMTLEPTVDDPETLPPAAA